LAIAQLRVGCHQAGEGHLAGDLAGESPGGKGRLDLGSGRLRPRTGRRVRLYLIDGSGFIFRAFHALPPLTRKTDGLPVGAVSGFCNMLWKLLVDMRAQADAPTHLAVIFDHSEQTFRNKLYDKYKAHRPPPPEDLVPQFPLVREATRAFGVPCLELPGYEADDLIAAYACKVRDLGGEVVIVSSDKDLMQLVGERVSMLDTMKNLRIGREQVFEKFGVPPDKVVDVQALCGDSVDNVPGAPGIGIKTAGPDQRIRRPRHPAGPRRRDQAAQAPRDPDRVRRPDPAVARAGAAGLRHPAARADRRPGGARAGQARCWPTSWSRWSSAPWPAGWRNARRGRRAGAQATPGAGGRAPPTAPQHGADRRRRLPMCASATSRPSTPGSRGPRRQGDRRLRHRDRRAVRASANLCGVSLAVAPGEACYIPVGHEHEHEATAAGLRPAPEDLDQIPCDEVIARLKPLLEDPAVLKVAQNGKYDMAVLARYGIDVARSRTPC
jgi:DNA polymerase-1